MTEQEHTTRTEEFEISGESLIAKIKELMHEGNIRRFIIKNDDGKVIMDLPLTVGVVGAILVPQLAAIGAVAAMVTRCRLVVERTE